MKFEINSVGTQDCVFPRFCSSELKCSHSSAHLLGAKYPNSNETGKVLFYMVTEAKIKPSLESVALLPLVSSQLAVSFRLSELCANWKTLCLYTFYIQTIWQYLTIFILMFSCFFLRFIICTSISQNSTRIKQITLCPYSQKRLSGNMLCCYKKGIYPFLGFFNISSTMIFLFL